MKNVLVKEETKKEQSCELTTNGDESMELLKVDINHAGYSDNKDVIKNVVLSLKSGELVGLIGPNGAGKSTPIKAIMGLLPLMDGKVEFTGESKNYAYIPEQPVLYDGLTLWEHLELATSAYEIEGNKHNHFEIWC